MLYVKWFLCLFPSFLMEIVGRVLAPILPFFVQEDGYLPSWLWWFQTPDNPCDGDEGHWERHPGTDAWSTYTRRVAWFWRNVTYGFNIEVIGFKHKDGDVRMVYGDPTVGDRTGVSGTCRWAVYRNNKKVAFQFYFVKHYKLLGHWRCIRIGAGYKVWGDITGEVYGQHWLYVNPIKGSGRED